MHFEVRKHSCSSTRNKHKTAKTFFAILFLMIHKSSDKTEFDNKRLFFDTYGLYMKYNVSCNKMSSNYKISQVHLCRKKDVKMPVTC